MIPPGIIADKIPGIIGVAGCGNMGLPMARCLHDAGYAVWGFDVRPASEFSGFEDRMIADPAVFAERVDTVISVVRDWEQTQNLLFDDQGIFNHAACPATLVISSTLSPRVLTGLEQRLEGGVEVIDAPMSGAPYRAESGRLTFMVGGNTATVDALMPVFRTMGEDVRHLGPAGRIDLQGHQQFCCGVRCGCRAPRLTGGGGPWHQASSLA